MSEENSEEKSFIPFGEFIWYKVYNKEITIEEGLTQLTLAKDFPFSDWLFQAMRFFAHAGKDTYMIQPGTVETKEDCLEVVRVLSRENFSNLYEIYREDCDKNKSIWIHDKETNSYTHINQVESLDKDVKEIFRFIDNPRRNFVVGDVEEFAKKMLSNLPFTVDKITGQARYKNTEENNKLIGVKPTTYNTEKSSMELTSKNTEEQKVIESMKKLRDLMIIKKKTR
jgi:hypothetical protein